MEQLIIELVAAHPKLMGLFIFMGILRAVFKPLMKAIEAYVESTPWESDNQALEKLKSTRGYRAVAFLVDYLASVKLPEKKHE
jgi:hypothetical protein